MNFQSLVGSLRRKAFSRANAQTRARKRTSRLRIEELEKREVPATLPAPQVDQTSFRSIQGEGWANAMMANPTNPNEIFMAYVHHAGNGTRIGIKFSTNGGTTWSAPLRFIDPILGGNNEYIPTGVDPVHLPAIVPFEDVSDPNLAWDKFGNVFLTYTEYHTPGDIAGRVMLRKFSFVGAPESGDRPERRPFSMRGSIALRLTIPTSQSIPTRVHSRIRTWPSTTPPAARKMISPPPSSTRTTRECSSLTTHSSLTPPMQFRRTSTRTPSSCGTPMTAAESSPDRSW